MTETPNSPRRSTLLAIFIPVFLLVFLLFLVGSTLITFILPETYSSTARIKVIPKPASLATTPSAPSVSDPYESQLIQTESEIIKSELILGKVVEDLDLNTAWGKKILGVGKLKTRESLTLLKARLEIRPVRNTSIIAVRVFSDRPDEAAQIANAVARIYTEHAASASEGLHVEIVDSAYPGQRPVRPNKPLNIMLGAIAGVVAGLGCAALLTWLAFLYRRKKSSPPTTTHGSGQVASTHAIGG